MHAFSVWAPGARSVDLVLPGDTGAAGAAGDGPAGGRVAMAAGDGGWWRAQVTATGHGTDYAFSVDGGDPVPDPRSPWQPDGVHGPSRVFDAFRHGWRDGGWAGRDARGAASYELHVGTFTPEGTLDAAAARLPHLVDLGVDVVELMPLAAFPGRWGWGYDGVHLYAVHEPYGGPAALQRFVDAAHGLGLAVCLDAVYNHLGPSGNYLSAFGPYFTDTHQTPWGSAVNLDAEGSHEVRRWVVDNALRWFRDFHVDALRLDAVHALVDTSPRHLLAQLADETAALAEELGRPLSLVAESDLNDAAMVAPTGGGGMGMTGQWSDDAHHALHTLLSGERQGYYVDFGPPEVLRTVWREAFWHAGRFSPFRGREWGVRVDPAAQSGHRFVVFASNHDQVGNRAVGDRPAATLSPGRLAAAAALVLTSPFTPMVFMGEEWGASTPFQYFTDHDAELGRLVTEGRRREFASHGWDAEDVPDPQDPATRDRSVLRWEETGEGGHAALLDWYRTLLRLRRDEPDLASDDLTRTDVWWDSRPEGTPAPEGGGDPAATDPPAWLVVGRGDVRVVCVLDEAGAEVPLPGDAAVLAALGPLRLEGRSVTATGEGVLVARLVGANEGTS